MKHANTMFGAKFRAFLNVQARDSLRLYSVSSEYFNCSCKYSQKSLNEGLMMA